MLRPLVLGLLLCSTLLARADTFTFTLEPDYVIPGGASGSLTTSAPVGYGDYGAAYLQITSISGEVDGSRITGLLPPGSFSHFAGPNVNVIDYDPSAINNIYEYHEIYSFLEPGVAFTVADGTIYDVFAYSRYVDLIEAQAPDGTYSLDRTNVDLVPTTVPEPSGTLLLLTGGTGLALLCWRRSLQPLS